MLVFYFRVLQMKVQHFHAKLPCRKPNLMLRQIEWVVQNGLITKNWLLPVTTTFLFVCLKI